MTNELIPSDYQAFLQTIKSRIQQAQLQAVLAVNRELIFLYWQIGRGILERQQQQGSPQLLEQVLRRARSGAAQSPVNPVFIDPQNGLDVIATERLVVCLRPGADAAHYFGPVWKQATPVWGTRDEFVLTLPQATAEQILAEVRRRAADPEVAWVEPDFIVEGLKCSTPSDPDFPRQWHLQNTGQGGGTAGADAHLPGAWDLTNGSSSIVIAVVDDGCQISHPDLAPNLFLNLHEIPGNGVDDDHNGVIDANDAVDSRRRGKQARAGLRLALASHCPPRPQADSVNTSRPRFDGRVGG